ncbi:MAG: tetratricopeptide repeat protein [Saprospiraceae bacterium]|nr:tetratricopeptide repeat protein [Saprospiraceae bacterium]
MDSFLLQEEQIRQLESQLETHESPLGKITTLEKLIAYYAFTQVGKAKQLLLDLGKILNGENLPDHNIQFFLASGFVDNQLYDYQSSHGYYLAALDLIEERGDVAQKVEVYIDLAGTLINLDRLKEASQLLEKSESLLENFPNHRLLSRLFTRRGYIHLHIGDQKSGVEALMEAEKMLLKLPARKTLKDQYFISLIYSGLGNVYASNDEGQKSVDAYKTALDISRENQMQTRMAWHLTNVGSAYMSLADWENAAKYFKEAIETQDDASELSRANAMANLGQVFLQKGKFDEAAGLFTKAEELYRLKPGNTLSNFAQINRYRGQMNQALGKIEEALTAFQKAYKFALETEDTYLLCGISKDITNFFASQQDYKNAYVYQNLYENHYEKYLDEVKERKVLELEIRYDLEKKKQEAELLKLQSSKLQMKALRAQMNPHFMHNALNSIQLYISSGDMTNASKYLAQFGDLMRQSLDYSEREIISLEKELEFLQNYLELNKMLRFENKMEYSIEVDDEIEEDIFGVPTMIVQPYVENAIEHGIRAKDNGKIKLSFDLYDDDTLLCIIEDDGIGREAARKRRLNDPRKKGYESMGTKITHERLAILNNQLGAEEQDFIKITDLRDEFTGKAKGTRVEIRIPITEV